MKIAIQIFLKQTRRSTKLLVLQLVLLCAAVAFFVVSMNLYANSIGNLRAVENAYDTIATMEFYGYVNEAGELVHPGDESCLGRHWMSVEDYDFSGLAALDFVKGIHLRTRVGAYIPGHIPVYDVTDRLPQFYAPGYVMLFKEANVIRFVLDAEEPLVIPVLEEDWQYIPFPIRILETSNSLLEYPDAFTLRMNSAQFFDSEQIQNEIRRLNRSDRTDQIVLYPDTEYVLAVSAGTVWEKDPDTGVYRWHDESGPYSRPEEWYAGIGFSLNLFNDYYETPCFEYTKHGYRPAISDSLTVAGPFALQRYEDVKDDPAWAEYVQAGEYSGSSFAVTLTEDISLVPAWYQGAMFLSQGRMITQQEYDAGAKVCMISAQMAAYQGWQVGDKLDMHLYAYEGFYDESSLDRLGNLPYNFLTQPSYRKDCGGFFEEDTYEIVGIFAQRDFLEYGDSVPEVYYNPWNAIYVPANAAPNAPEGPVQPSLITISLENGSIGAFKKAVAEMGLTEFDIGEYEIQFRCFDQGYGKIKPGLDEMHRNAVLLLSLSGLLLAVTLVLTAFLFSRQHMHSAGILRMLGGSKGQTFVAVSFSAAAEIFFSGIAGSIVGWALTERACADILGDITETAKVALSVGADLLVTVLSGVGCMLLFLGLVTGFVLGYVGEEPRALLPTGRL